MLCYVQGMDTLTFIRIALGSAGMTIGAALGHYLNQRYGENRRQGAIILGILFAIGIATVGLFAAGY